MKKFPALLHQAFLSTPRKQHEIMLMPASTVILLGPPLSLTVASQRLWEAGPLLPALAAPIATATTDIMAAALTAWSGDEGRRWRQCQE